MFLKSRYLTCLQFMPTMISFYSCVTENCFNWCCAHQQHFLCLQLKSMSTRHLMLWVFGGFLFVVFFFLIKMFHSEICLNFLHGKKRKYTTRVFKDKCEAFQFCQNKSKASLSRLTCTLLCSFKKRLYVCIHFFFF